MGWIDTGVRRLIYVTAIALTAAGLATGVGVLESANIFGVLYFFFCWFPVVVVHELGHAIAAEIVGWRTWVFHAAPFAIRLRPFSIRIVGNMEGPDVGGFVLALPRTVAADTWQRQAWFTVGGPIASWVMAAACFAYAWRPQVEADWVDQLAAASGFYSLAAALLSSWPNRASRPNDAAILVDIWQKKAASGAPLSGFWQARYLWTFGVPQTLIEDWMTEACDAPPTQRHIDFILFTRLLDCLARRDEAGVRAQAAALAARSPGSPENAVAQGFVAAWYDADIARADDHLVKVPSSLPDDDILAVKKLALATIFRLTGETEAAEKCADSAQLHAWNRWRFRGSQMDSLAKLAMTRRLPAPLA